MDEHSRTAPIGDANAFKAHLWIPTAFGAITLVIKLQVCFAIKESWITPLACSNHELRCWAMTIYRISSEFETSHRMHWMKHLCADSSRIFRSMMGTRPDSPEAKISKVPACTIRFRAACWPTIPSPPVMITLRTFNSSRPVEKSRRPFNKWMWALRILKRQCSNFFPVWLSELLVLGNKAQRPFSELCTNFVNPTRYFNPHTCKQRVEQIDESHSRSAHCKTPWITACPMNSFCPVTLVSCISPE